MVGALILLAAPNARAQVGVNITFGAPAWGPQVPHGTQYYYIPEIDGYYDLYSQQYLVCDDGYWVPLPQLYGYDPYRFHPVAIAYRGREPWCQRDHYHQRYAYQPYCNYGRSDYGNGYYSNGYGHHRYPRGGYYGGGRGYNDRDDRRRGYGGSYGGNYDDRHDHDDHDGRGNYGGGSYGNSSRGDQPQRPGSGGYGYGNDPRGSQPQVPQQPGGYGALGQTPSGPGNGNSQGNNSHDQGSGRHGRD